MRQEGLAFALAAALGPAALSQAAEPLRFGMVGLARQQSAQFSAVLTQPPDPGSPGCRLTLSFLDAMGEPFHDRAGNEVKKTVVLRNGAAEFLRLRSADVLAEGQARASIRAALTDVDPCFCQHLATSLELVASSGRSILAFNPGDVGRNDPPPPTPFCPPRP
jgi:hypothetical protein